MATKIVTKNSSTASAVPTASDLVQGELAVNVADKRLFTEDNGGSIVELGTNPSTIDINAGTIDGTAIGASSASTGAFTALTATGAFTSRGIDDNADATAITIDSSENVGIGTSSPSSILSTSGTDTTAYSSSSVGGQDSSATLKIQNLTTSANSFASIDFNTNNNRVVNRIVSSHGSTTTDGFLAFVTEGSGTPAERMRIDSAGNVGIGTSSPGEKLQVEGTVSATGMKIGGNGTDINSTLLGANSLMAFKCNSTERMRIDSSGNVLVGKSASSFGTAGVEILPDGRVVAGRAGETLVLNRLTSDGDIAIFRKDGTTVGSIGVEGGDLAIGNGDAGIQFVNGNEHFRPFNVTTNAATDNLMDIGSSSKRFKDLYLSGRVSVGTKAWITSDANVGYFGGSSGQANHISFYDSLNLCRIYTNGSERMRIDSSGNLLVGKTSSSFDTQGVAFRGSPDVGASNATFTRDDDNVAAFNRLNSDGSILTLNKDGASVGSIGASGGDMFAGTGDTGLRFVDADNAIVPWNTSSNAGRDNAIDLGKPSERFDDIYATNGTIQTSDRNEKQDIAELSDAEQRVAVACKGLLRKFRWKDSVAEKGDDARIHFGIIAQDLQAAFEAEGLDASDYAMFISTTWTDEETNEEKTRMGVRYSELLAFIIAAI